MNKNTNTFEDIGMVIETTETPEVVVKPPTARELKTKEKDEKSLALANQMKRGWERYVEIVARRLKNWEAKGWAHFAADEEKELRARTLAYVMKEQKHLHKELLRLGENE